MLPVISIFEVRTLLPQAEVAHGGLHGEHDGIETDHMDQINAPKGVDSE
jgi:hypothetical protein